MLNHIKSNPASAQAPAPPVPARLAAPKAGVEESLEISQQAASLGWGPKPARTLEAAVDASAGARLRAYGLAQAAGAPKGAGFDGEA